MVNSDIITDKKIRKSSEILSTIFDISPDAIALTRVSDGKFIDCNQEYLNQIGYSQEEVIGHTSKELNLYVDENRQKYANEILIKKTVTNFELKVRRKDGTLIHVLYSGRLIYVEGEQILLNIGKNITERKKTEESLYENKTKLETVIQSMNDAIFVSDKEGRFIDFNEAFATFHKFKSKEECYKTLDEYSDYIDVYFDNGKLAPIDMWAVPRALKGETVSNAEYMLQRKDTREKWWGNYSFAPIRGKDGNIMGSVVVARDITEQKIGEKELKLLLKEKEVLIDTSPCKKQYADYIEPT